MKTLPILNSVGINPHRSLRKSSHHLPVHGDDVADEGTLLERRDVAVGEPVAEGHLGAAGNRHVGSAVGDERGPVGRAVAAYGAVGHRGEV